MTKTRWWVTHTHAHTIFVKVFIRERSTNVENEKTQAKRKLNGQVLSTGRKDRTKYSVIHFSSSSSFRSKYALQ